MYLQVCLIPLIGILNRIRGGFLPTGHTQVARAIFAVGMAVAMALVNMDWKFLLTAPLWFLCELFPNGDYLGMESFGQFFEATAVGFCNVLLPCAAMYFIGVNPMALTIAGLTKGLCYLVAKYIPSHIPNFQQGAEMAELLFGLALGAGIAF